MNCYVIMCNDSPEFVVMGDEGKAESKKAQLLSKDKASHEQQFGAGSDYLDRFFWRTVKVETE